MGDKQKTAVSGTRLQGRIIQNPVCLVTVLFFAFLNAGILLALDEKQKTCGREFLETRYQYHVAYRIFNH
jgi:hypothetical protein